LRVKDLNLQTRSLKVGRVVQIVRKIRDHITAHNLGSDDLLFAMRGTPNTPKAHGTAGLQRSCSGSRDRGRMADLVLLADARIAAVPVDECGEPLVDVRGCADIEVDPSRGLQPSQPG
jgi:hypothetical protein